jgi:hypothetical protein
MTRPGRRTRVALNLAVLLLTAACSPPGDKEAPLQTMSQAEVEALARYEADAIVTLTGGELGGWRTNATPCQGRDGEVADDGRWNLSGFAHVTLPADQHVIALRDVEESWTTQVWGGPRQPHLVRRSARHLVRA